MLNYRHNVEKCQLFWKNVHKFYRINRSMAWFRESTASLSPEQEAAKRRELEQQLYEVFRKYADKRQSEEAGA